MIYNKCGWCHVNNLQMIFLNIYYFMFKNSHIYLTFSNHLNNYENSEEFYNKYY